jgi:hydroxymethylpyrimidine/phosphomethylpyrimidine kinase
VSKHGDALLREDAVEALRKRVVPLATLVTPNLPEAAGLAGFDVETRSDMERAARTILELGARSVLVKGGHLEGNSSDDLFADGRQMEWLAGERLSSENTHGTGCVLSAAVAAYLARGKSLPEAVRHGKEFVTDSIRHALALGGGIGPVNPAWRLLEQPP